MLSRLTGYLQGDGYQARAFRGTALTLVNFGGGNFLRLASNLVLTRLLFPEAFGLMALVGVVMTGVAMFSDIGIRGSIIQDKRGGEEAFLNTAWTLQIIRGFVLGLAVVLLANPIATFYEEPLLAELLMVSAIIPVIRGFGSTQVYFANREMHLGRLTALGLGSQFFDITVMVLLALWLNSVWALAIGPIIGAFAVVIATHLVMPGPRNRLQFERDTMTRMFRYGRYIFISTLGTFVIRQGDTAVLGRFVELDQLAFYRIAFFFAAVPMMLGRMLSDRVIFPLYARRPPGENDAYRRKIAKARFLMTGGLTAVVAFLALTGDWLVRLLYDPRYESAGILLVVVAVFTLPELITMTYAKLLNAAGQSGRFAIFTLTNALVQLGLLLLLVPLYGVLGAATASGLAVVLTYPLLVWMIHPLGGWGPGHDLVYAALAVAISALVTFLKWDLLVATFAQF